MIRAAAFNPSAISRAANGYSETVTAGSTGTYATPKAANTAITGAALGVRYQVLLDAETYSADHSWELKDYVDLIGKNRDQTVIHYELPDSVAIATIPNTSTLEWNGTAKLKNLTITGRNVRYPIHSDSNGDMEDRVQEIEDCWIEHYGCQGAMDYQDANGGSAANVWGSWHAWGYGASSGMQVIARRTTFKSILTAFYMHTNLNFTKPCYHLLEDCSLISTSVNGVIGGWSLYVAPMGSGTNDIVELRGCRLLGDIGYVPGSPWMPTTLADQPANHCEVDIIGTGNTPAVFRITEFGRALKIESADTTSSSSVAVSGSAVDVLFGTVYSKPGSGGIKGYVYGHADISGTAVGINSDQLITSMGKRLGDCTGTNKVLEVTVDGGTPITITFDQNYTNTSNATILSTINTALGSAATASEYNVGGRYRPHLWDEEELLKNTTTTGIPMGSVVTYDTSRHSIRLMTSADAGSRFVGVAWEDIYPGTFGRVKTAGWILMTDVLRTDSASFGVGDTFSVDASAAGKVAKGGSQGLLKAIRSDAVEVRAK